MMTSETIQRVTSEAHRTSLWAMLIVLGPMLVIELATGRFFHPKARRRDAITELLSSVTILLVVYPSILVICAALMRWWWPALEGAWFGVPLWLGFLAFVIGDDLVQYLWHWYCHSSPTMFNLHRFHHSAPYMGLRMAYRDNPCFQVLMPNSWISAALLYAGLIKPYFLYSAVKMIVAVSAHSSVPWDEKLYEVRALRPVMWVVERLISTPATHAAHHGLHQSDGITHYNGNYCTVFFFWDVLFGTARISRKRPAAHGVENLPEVGVLHETLWPIFRDPKASAQFVQAQPSPALHAASERTVDDCQRPTVSSHLG